MKFDPERVWINVRKSETDDLINRITVYRAGMEPEAIDIIETELRNRGVTPEQIQEYADRMDKVVRIRPDGVAPKCTLCREPAVAEGWGWHRLWDRLPLFPRYFYFCQEHKPTDFGPEESAKQEP